MKGIRFYLEYSKPKDKRKATVKNTSNHSGNVAAVIYCNGLFLSSGKWCYEGIAAIQEHKNCPVGSTSIAVEYLNEKCKRIPEAMAREIHPNLFAFLDRN